MSEDHPESGSAHGGRNGEGRSRIGEAVASCVVVMIGTNPGHGRRAEARKGDALEVARIAGIMAAKKTSELIPLCHPIGIGSVEVTLAPVESGIEIVATVSHRGTNRGRDGGADRSDRRRADGLRHGEGDRARRGDNRCPAYSRRAAGKSGTWTRSARTTVRCYCFGRFR